MTTDARSVLRNAVHDDYAEEEWTDLVTEALAAERRATVERIRKALLTARAYNASEARYYMDEDIEAILDAEAER